VDHRYLNAGEIMNIAVLGTGNVGSALGTDLSRAGHDVVYGSRPPEGKAASKWSGQ
jgi:predicted dinucleotide-binding enzyme